MSALFEVANLSLDEANSFIGITRGLTSKKGDELNINNRTSEIAKIGITAYSLVHSCNEYNFFSELNTDDKVLCKKFILEYFGLEGYNALVKINLKPTVEQIVLWGWELNANRDNKFISVLQALKTKGEYIADQSELISNLKLNSLLKKQTEYFKNDWIDFDAVYVSKIRFGLDESMKHAPESVKISELVSVMHFKKMIDDLSSNNNFLIWQSNIKNSKANTYIDYNEYSNLEELLNKIKMPLWGLKFAKNICKHNLSQNGLSVNKRELFNELNVLIDKNVLSIELSNENVKIYKTLKV